MAKRTSKAASRYSVHPTIATVRSWIETLKERTGRTLEEWDRLIRRDGPAGEAARREWLRKEHGMGTNNAGWFAAYAEGKNREDTDPAEYLRAAAAYVEAMYAGPKASLRPLYEELLDVCLAIGPDAKACPCKTMTPIFREHVVAQIKPATRTRLDLGLSLGAMMKTGKKSFPDRLIDTGGFAKKDRITHRIPIQKADEIDDEVKTWLRTAYDLDAP